MYSKPVAIEYADFLLLVVGSVLKYGVQFGKCMSFKV